MNDRVKSFAIAALIAAYLGFWSSWVIPAGVAQLAFFVFVIGAFVSAVLASGNGASSRPPLIGSKADASRGLRQRTVASRWMVIERSG
jgi:uncharacterized membrane protein YtjA (UPF0391 family)